ncbi:MAG: glycosyltransferase family 9 protein [Candidatus Omnitrophota bacterium]|nr:glycosyltransferase family 9 protein [Candidatus Omnitrophota bacterium]
MKKILIVNPFGIGDVIFSTPLVDILKKNFPDSYIGYLCNRRVSELIATNPCLDKIFVYEKDDYRDAWRLSKIEFAKKILALLKSIKKERFDVSIDLTLNYQYSMFLKLLGVRRRLGFNYRNRGKFLTDRIDMEGFDDKHVIEYYLDVLKLLDIDTDKYEIEPRIYASPIGLKFADRVLKENGMRESDQLIGMLPGCGESWGEDAGYRRWPGRNFAVLADMLVENYGARIILLGNQKETGLCGAVAAAMKNHILNYCGKTTIDQFLGILKRCSVVITNDGGPLHMAVGLGVKTISIFGPVDENVYGPYGNKHNHIALSKKGLPCRPCYRRFKYAKCEKRVCLDLVTAEEVFRAAQGLLSRENGKIETK